MNYYKRHIGDYIKTTAHLSLLEHGIYSRLIDVYYTREDGIPESQAARLIGARTKDELSALKIVLNEFFVCIDGLWVNEQFQEEIEVQKSKAERNREVGKKGGRPHKSGNPEITQTVSENNPGCLQEETKTVSENNPSVRGTTSHKPITNKPLKDITPARQGSPKVSSLEISESAMQEAGISAELAVEYLRYRRKKQAPLTPRAWSGILKEIAKTSLTVDDALEKAMMRGWQGFEADWAAKSMDATPDYSTLRD